MKSLRYLSSGFPALSAVLVAVTLSTWPAAAIEPGLTASPQTVQAGATISLSFTGFSPCSAEGGLAVYWDKELLPYNAVAGPPASSSFTVDVVAPSSSSLGPHLINAGCSTGTQYSVQVRTLVYVVALSPFPLSVQAGEPVTITGQGFTQCMDPAGSTAVELSANGTPLATASGSNGDFQQAITVPPGTPAGPYPVTAQCPAQPGSGLTSTDVYVVTLALSPSSGVPGTTISVTGDGYSQCHEMQLQLLRDTPQAVATSGPIVPANGSFTAEVTVPSGAIQGNDYRVDAGCYQAAGRNVAIAVEPFSVTLPATPTSPPPSSAPPSSAPPSSPASPATTPGPSGAPTLVTETPGLSHGRPGGRWAPVALVGGTGAGLALAALLLVRALSMVHWKRGRGWVNTHLRVVPGSAGPLSADVEHRPGASSVSVGLEPHVDYLGHQQYEEVMTQ